MRSFTWIKDLVKANLQAAISEKSCGQAYNAASGIKVTINDLALKMLEYLDASKSIKVKYGEPLIGDIMNFDINNNKIQEDLGITFNQDFWGTLRIAIADTETFLGKV